MARKKQTGGKKDYTFRIDEGRKGYVTKEVQKGRRKGRITKSKYTADLLADEPGSVYSVKVKQKVKDGQLKKRVSKVIDKEGARKTKIKTRRKKGKLVTKKVVWEDGKRKVTRYKKGGFIEPKIPNLDDM